MISPTRTNLINTRKSMRLASRGHDMLKRKREVLVVEFLRLLKESTNGREYLQQLLQEAYRSLAVASTYVGDFELETVSNYMSEPNRIKISRKNIMGVNIPEISNSDAATSIEGRGYSLISTSVAVDDVSESFDSVINSVIDLAKREQGLKRLVIEIEKVKRRVNALEYRMMPRLSRQSRYISMRLEELERDNFSALKHVKKRLAWTDRQAET
ncbi:MAG: V-type ATP synthase subunit D [Candidatus Micrarchaeaceae archaeon]